MGGGSRFGLEREGQNPFDLGIGDLARLSGTRLVEQTIRAGFAETMPPFPYGRGATFNSAAIAATEPPSAARTTILDLSASA
jgi:hypothetical protein